MSDRPNVEQTYLALLPKAVPRGQFLVHNHVRPARRLSRGGFRAWIQPTVERLEVCDCGWGPEIGPHYRVARKAPKPPPSEPVS